MGNDFNTTPAGATPTGDDYTLSGVRKQFIRITMRYDLLVNGDLTANVDNGANYFINLGQDYLDQTVLHPKSFEKYFFAVAVGEYKKQLDRALVIRELYFVTSSEETDLTDCYLPSRSFRGTYGSLVSEWDSGTPAAWTIDEIGAYGQPEDSGDLETGVASYDSIVFGNHFEKTGIIWTPKADTTGTLIAVAKAKSKKLSADTDVSFWTVNHPYLLALSAAYCFERSMKNETGMRTWLTAMAPEVDAIDSNLVALEIEGLSMRLPR